ncbi:MAG: hypothetical protein KKA73_11245 [Chloroflexi bacterium]|nr:hypothetical protein [Chloroflexota bacterium]MBU1748253.1 hypothetical protein [Chloroflexota bacterium]
MKNILLCGNSIFIAGLAASLQGVEGLAVTNADLDGLRDLRGPFPDVVIIDLNDADAARAVARFCARPGLLVLGVDAARSVLTVLSGSQMAVSDTGDLAQLVKRFVLSETGSGSGY